MFSVPTSPAPSTLYPTDPPIIPATAASQVDGAFEAVYEAVYRDHGFEIVDVTPGEVEQRAATIEARIAQER